MKSISEIPDTYHRAAAEYFLNNLLFYQSGENRLVHVIINEIALDMISKQVVENKNTTEMLACYSSKIKK